MQDIVFALPRIIPIPQRSVDDIDGIAIHHSGDEGNPWSWAKYHTSPPHKGGPSWGPGHTIGYHSAIMRSGMVYKTALDQDRTPGVAHHNYHLLHIVCQGDLTQQAPTQAQFESLLRTIYQYQGSYYTRITTGRIRTHEEWQDDPDWATFCPGISYLGVLVRGAIDAGAGLAKPR